MTATVKKSFNPCFNGTYSLTKNTDRMEVKFYEF